MDEHEEQNPEDEFDADPVVEAEPEESEPVAEETPDLEAEELEPEDPVAQAVETEESDAEGFLLNDDLDLDVEAALASVASLDDALAEHAAAEQKEAELLAAEAAAIEQADTILQEETERRAAYHLPRPPVMTILHRGQAASAVPALLLMGIGAWLTFALTTSDSPPSTGTITMVVMGALGVSLLAYWMTAGRWARGSLLCGITLLVFAAVTFYVTQSDQTGAEGWPLYLIALAVAIFLNAMLSPPVGEGHVLLGVLVAITGMAALAVTLDFLSQDVLDVAGAFAPVVLVVGVLIFLLPRIPKRRE